MLRTSGMMVVRRGCCGRVTYPPLRRPSSQQTLVNRWRSLMVGKASLARWTHADFHCGCTFFGGQRSIVVDIVPAANTITLPSAWKTDSDTTPKRKQEEPALRGCSHDLRLWCRISTKTARRKLRPFLFGHAEKSLVVVSGRPRKPKSIHTAAPKSGQRRT